MASSVSRLVELMGGDASAVHHRTAREASIEDEVVRVGAPCRRRRNLSFFAKARLSVLRVSKGMGRRIFCGPSTTGRGSAQRHAAAPASFVSGDRQKEGVFPLWTVLANIAIGRIGPRPALGSFPTRAERLAATPSAEQLRLDVGRFNSRIVELSGGNQQKALVARAVAAKAPIVLLDDPTRGVDIATKQDFYRLCSELARQGRTLVWHTTEDAELLACDRVLVFANGQIVRELSGPRLSEEAIVAASFSHVATSRSHDAGAIKPRLGPRLVRAAPFIGLALVLSVMIAANPAVASVFGLDLLLMPALSLVLITMAQMFVVGGGN